jgi:hypothetical protein
MSQPAKALSQLLALLSLRTQQLIMIGLMIDWLRRS